MEDVLDVYERPYDPRFPVIYMDEASTQLIGEVRKPLPPKPGQLLRIDSEYERLGTCNLFMFCEPLGGWRNVRVTQRRTKADWAYALQDQIIEHDSQAQKLILLTDHLNTHSPSCFYEVFGPSTAHWLTERLEIHYSPKHGRRLNIAKCELSVLGRQCLNRRIDDALELGQEANAWQYERDRIAKKINWQFRTCDARQNFRTPEPAGNAVGPYSHLG